MVTTRDDIRKWLQDAMEKGAKFMIVMCDTFDWSNYPIIVRDDENPKQVAKFHEEEYGGILMECYDLSMDLEDQLAERRAFHWGDNEDV